MEDRANNKVIANLLSGWQWTISHRYELLSALSDKDLSWKPPYKATFQDFQYQFACIASTQKAYTSMLAKRKFNNSFFGQYSEDFRKIYTVKGLIQTLRKLDKEFVLQMRSLNDDDLFDWGDFQAPVYSVIITLQEHERLHHGQLISYFTLREIPFPQQFKRDWHL